MDDALKEQQDLYDETWRKGLEAGKEERGNLQTNLEFLKTIDVLKPGDKILEIGCGIGTIVSRLSAEGYSVAGIDISRRAIAYGLEKYGDINLEVQAAETLPYENQSFDVVLSFDLLEHIADVDRHVAEVSRVLRPEGRYLFQTPNKYSNAIAETLSHKSLKWRRAHPSLHTPRQLKRRLAAHGFEARFIKMNTINEFTLAKLRKRIGPVSGIFKHVDFRRLPLCLQTNLYVIARKT
ncbi:MAG: class I SAM-dependent methyltransferase [Sedimentisphaerales bacterium]|nr:class I SAM-dependent methyltransferase [Sedimentisphaerales bacterium]